MAQPVLQGERVLLRPVTPADLDALVAIIQNPGVREWWWDSGDAPGLREGLPNDGCAFVVELNGETAGWLGFDEEDDPGYRHASIDISLDPRFHGQGVGTGPSTTAPDGPADRRAAMSSRVASGLS